MALSANAQRERTELLMSIWDKVAYWSDPANTPEYDWSARVQGVAFSVLCELDGVAEGPSRAVRVVYEDGREGDDLGADMLHEAFYATPHFANDSPRLHDT